MCNSNKEVMPRTVLLREQKTRILHGIISEETACIAGICLFNLNSFNYENSCISEIYCM